MSGRLPADFDRNVFINCPFDPGYKSMFEAIVFTILQCGFIPRCALELSNSGQARIHKILDIIEQCKLGVHDISNTELDIKYNLPRFNMPLELGLFMGCARYGSTKQKTKTCLVFDIEKFRFQKFISDIGGQDIAEHSSKSEKLIKKIRDWLQGYTDATPFPGGTAISAAYEIFRKDLPSICADLELEEKNLTFKDLGNTIQVYLARSKPAAGKRPRKAAGTISVRS